MFILFFLYRSQKHLVIHPCVSCYILDIRLCTISNQQIPNHDEHAVSFLSIILAYILYTGLLHLAFLYCLTYNGIIRLL